ncbi:MAG TPA: ABC transporter substrate-binding protein [Clostridiaceae bacterium]|mgnify:CR=1 FL=1|nr:ABC transporter substrate-binding protein [Clostridiaceae bacterium]
MVAKKSLSILIMILLIISVLLSGCSKNVSGQSNKSISDKKGKIKIGIMQIIEHEALDAARKGFIDALASKNFKDGENIEIDYQNAQGDAPTAQTIAQNFVSGKKDIILAIATPTAQAAYNATKDIPILITAVTDPVKSGLAKSWDKPGTNVTGTSDAAPVQKQFELLKKLVPNSKKVGVLYNTSETNSELQVNDVKAISPKFGLEVVPVGITSTNDIPQALDSLLSKVDVLYIPTDNMIVSAMPIISARCIEEKMPIIGAEEGTVNKGALATEGIDYYKLGFQTGLVAVDVINGEKPSDIPITTLKDAQLIINEDTASKLGINIPDDLKEGAKIVKGGE